MSHFLYAVKGQSPAPQGYGDTASWLNFYKLNPGAGETYLPVSDDFKAAKEGDTLWFSIDGELVAQASILRVVEDSVNARFEVWYNAEKLERTKVSIGIMDPLSGPIPEEQAKIWDSIFSSL